jgi:hypothetical protein
LHRLAEIVLYPGGIYLFLRWATAFYALVAVGSLIPVKCRQAPEYRSHFTRIVRRSHRGPVDIGYSRQTDRPYYPDSAPLQDRLSRSQGEVPAEARFARRGGVGSRSQPGARHPSVPRLTTEGKGARGKSGAGRHRRVSASSGLSYGSRRGRS